MYEGNQLKAHWYKRWWGVLLIAVLVLVLSVLVIFLFLTGRYWWEIKQGRGGALQSQFADGFTAAGPGAGAGANNVADRIALETTDDPFTGRRDAEIVLVEFVDYKCPNCKISAPTIKRIAEQFGHQVKIILRDFPIESIHPGATKLAELTYCANQLDGFWQVHDLLFNLQDNLSPALTDSELQIIAAQAGLDPTVLKECLEGSEAAAEVAEDYSAGLRFGVRGTPTFFVNGVMIEGAVPWSRWQSYFESLNL
jgi:protein-disulfide isomerase